MRFDDTNSIPIEKSDDLVEVLSRLTDTVEELICYDCGNNIKFLAIEGFVYKVTCEDCGSEYTIG